MSHYVDSASQMLRLKSHDRLCTCLYMDVCPQGLCGGQRRARGSCFSSFYPVDPKDQIQVIRLGSKVCLPSELCHR